MKWEVGGGGTRARGLTILRAVSQHSEASKGEAGVSQRLERIVPIPPEIHCPGPLGQNVIVAHLPHLVHLEDGRQEEPQELNDELIHCKGNERLMTIVNLIQ